MPERPVFRPCSVVWGRPLYAWVLAAIVAGGVFGALDPPHAVALKPLGDGFIALVKMLIAPVIFCTVVLGIAGAGDMKKVGRVGIKAIGYFEVVSALRARSSGSSSSTCSGLAPGFNVDPASLDSAAGGRLRAGGRGPDGHRVPAQHHPTDLRRRLHRLRRPPAGAPPRDPLRLRAAARRAESGEIVQRFVEACRTCSLG